MFGQLHAPALNLALTLALTLAPTLAPTLLQFDVHFEVHNGILGRSADLLTLNRSGLLTLKPLTGRISIDFHSEDQHEDVAEPWDKLTGRDLLSLNR